MEHYQNVFFEGYAYGLYMYINEIDMCELFIYLFMNSFIYPSNIYFYVQFLSERLNHSYFPIRLWSIAYLRKPWEDLFILKIIYIFKY